MENYAVLGSGLTDHAKQLTRTFASILAGCGFSSAEILCLMSGATEGLQEGLATPSLGSSIGDHLACTDIVFLWRHDPVFVDEHGEPKRLDRRGADCSFDQLVRKAAPGSDSDRLFEYLVSLGVINAHSGDACTLVTESVLACSGTNGGRIASEVVLLHLLGFLGSVEFNLRTKTGNASGRFERACYSQIPANLVPVFEKLVETRGQNFVDSVDEWLVRHRTEDSKLTETLLVGAGAYVFVRSPGRSEMPEKIRRVPKGAVQT